jgi:hypothetical protein
MIDSGAMPSNKKKASHSDQDSSYAVGDRIKVNLHTGRIVDATVKAIIERTDGKKPQDKPQLVTLEQLGEKLIEAVKKLSPSKKAELRKALYAQLGLKD